MFELTQEQKANIEKYILEFKKFKNTDKAKEWEKERIDRKKLYEMLLNEKEIDNLSEEGFAKIIESLWASELWTRKDYLVNKILKDNGIQKIKTELKKLIYGKDPLDERFDNFKDKIKGLGPSSITEILVFVEPKKYCIWNTKPKNILPFLGIKNLPPTVFKYQINGKQYIQCTEALNSIRHELEKNGMKNPDFIDVDFFLAFIFYEIYLQQKEIEKSKEIEGEKVSSLEELDEYYKDQIMKIEELQSASLHDKICEMIEWIGTWNNYVVKRRYKVKDDSPYELDVAWLDNEENPEIAFEVHDGGILEKDKDSLKHAKDFNFRKVIWVCMREDRKRVFTLLRYDPLKNWIDIWSIKSIYELYTQGKKFYELYKKLEKSKYKEFKELEFV